MQLKYIINLSRSFNNFSHSHMNFSTIYTYVYTWFARQQIKDRSNGYTRVIIWENYISIDLGKNAIFNLLAE